MTAVLLVGAAISLAFGGEGGGLKRRACEPTMAAPRTTNPVLDGRPYSLNVLGPTATRSALSLGLSAAALSVSLPALPGWWSEPLESIGASPIAPLLTIVAMSALVAYGSNAFGVDCHPIPAKARGLTPPKAFAFQLLGLSAPLLASLSVAFGFQPLPIEGNAVEFAHCALPIVLWQADVRLLRWLNPHVEWPAEAVRLQDNYLAEHAAPIGAVLAFVGVLTFEVYVQQLLATPLTLAGFPLLSSALLIALTAGLLNHALANGLSNGLQCAEFYWTVSLMFALSNSALPVGIYHHLMYSMPTFMKPYQQAVDTAPSPAVHTALLHTTLATWHCAVFAALATIVPTAADLRLPLPNAPSLPSLDNPGAIAGSLCVGLFAFAAAGTVSDYLGGAPDEEKPAS